MLDNHLAPSNQKRKEIRPLLATTALVCGNSRVAARLAGRSEMSRKGIMASAETEADEPGGIGHEDRRTRDHNSIDVNSRDHVVIERLIEQKKTGDEVDAMPKRHSFTCWDLLVLIWSVGSYLADVGTDVALAYFYWHDDHIAYFSLTIAFVVIPSMTVTGISMSWYLDDARRAEEACRAKGTGDSSASLHTANAVPRWIWAVRFIMHMLQMGPALRYIESIAHGFRSAYYEGQRRQDCFHKMVAEDADASLLRLFEAFMESAPQLVLQLYILARNAQTIRLHYILGFHSNIHREQFRTEKIHAHPGVGKEDPFLWQSSAATVVFQATCVFTSLVSLAWGLTGYQRLARFTMPNKNNMTVGGCIVYFLWRLGTIAARVLALALFASVFSFWVGVVCIIRWIIMTTWLVTEKTGTCVTRFREFLFSGALAVVYNFTFLNVVDEPTRWKVTIFYSMQFIEDSVLMALWFVFGDRYAWFYYPALAIQIGAFWIGIAFMVLYYTNFHPNGQMPLTSCCSLPTRAHSYRASMPIPGGDSRDGGMKGFRRASRAVINRSVSTDWTL